MPHIHELYDFTITVFIVHDNKVLLVHHPRYNKWIPMGGHIELDENPEQALYREIKEETGLDVKILSTKPQLESEGTTFLLTPNYMDVHEANPPHKHISLTYFATSITDAAQLSDEHLDMHWLSETELTEAHYDLSPAVQFYCREALRAAI
jgi:ADP-ribose pyrophosphatase YjhB (NUDIX family)